MPKCQECNGEKNGEKINEAHCVKYGGYPSNSDHVAEGSIDIGQ